MLLIKYWTLVAVIFDFKGAECQHSLSYWTGRDYIGVGPGLMPHLNVVQSLLLNVMYANT